MSNIMFKIATTDYSANVQSEQYTVRSVKQYDGWTDANGREHRSVYRERIEGTFVMYFPDITAYDAFCAYVEANCDYDSSLPCTVWVNNQNASCQGNFFVEFNASRFKNPKMQDSVELIKVTITER